MLTQGQIQHNANRRRPFREKSRQPGVSFGFGFLKALALVLVLGASCSLGGWGQRITLKPWLRGIAAGPISDQEYVWALKLAKIGLDFVSEWNYNQTSGRSYEIPACGTFLLAMRMEEHQECYREGDEAEFFDREEELVIKAKRYLADDLARQRVASNGRIRCLISDYSRREIMARDWQKIRPELGSESGAAV